MVGVYFVGNIFLITTYDHVISVCLLQIIIAYTKNTNILDALFLQFDTSFTKLFNYNKMQSN